MLCFIHSRDFTDEMKRPRCRLPIDLFVSDQTTMKIKIGLSFVISSVGRHNYFFAFL